MVPYSSIRSQVKSGDVFAWAGNGIINDIIKYVEHGLYTHVGIAWVYSGRVFILQATGLPDLGAQYGVGLVAASETKSYGKCSYFNINTIWTPELENNALSYLGKPYSYLTAIKVGLSFTPNPNSEICSVYVAQILNNSGFNLSSKGMTPQLLVDDLIKSNYQKLDIDITK